jgi:CxxC motif-containing protein
MGAEPQGGQCLRCPIGCALELAHQGDTLQEVSREHCDRETKYVRPAVSEPGRGLTTTVPITGGRWPRLPVKVTAPVPRSRVMEAARIIHGLRVTAPVRLGDVLLEGLLGDPALRVVATRSMARADETTA